MLCYVMLCNKVGPYGLHYWSVRTMCCVHAYDSPEVKKDLILAVAVVLGPLAVEGRPLVGPFPLRKECAIGGFVGA
jgi:hypothetical protein